MSGEGRVQELVSRSLRRTEIGMRRRIDWEHVTAQEKPSGSVTMLGTPIHIHKAVTGRENDGMLDPPLESRRAPGMGIRIGKHCPLLVLVVLPNCIRRAPHEFAHSGKVVHGSLQEVGVGYMHLRHICAHMRRVVAQREEVLDLLAILNK
jgi:hypothetical protein